MFEDAEVLKRSAAPFEEQKSENKNESRKKLGDEKSAKVYCKAQ